MRQLTLILALCALPMGSLWAADSFMPENDLHWEDNHLTSNIDKQTFDEILTKAERLYNPILSALGANLKVNRLWSNSTVNASANQRGSTWHINMYGGLARRPEVTPDGFTMVVCHELGHHLGGVVFYKGFNAWAASEGQSDYFATHACAKVFWQDEPEINASYADKILTFQGGAEVKAACDEVYNIQSQRDLCYRTSVAGHSLGTLLATLGRQGNPEFDTPDTRKAKTTYRRHPKGQCRLDTYVAGALCGKAWENELIPGKIGGDRNSLKAFLAAHQYSCHAYDSTRGFRPSCWFNPADVRPPATEFNRDLAMSVEADQATVTKIPFAAGDSLTLALDSEALEGAQITAAIDQEPTDTAFDCQITAEDSSDCSLTAQEQNSWVYIKAKADVAGDLNIATEQKGHVKICSQYGGGQGIAFECFTRHNCQLIDAKAGQELDNWCLLP